jgi:prolyl-tRNA synthetase
MAEEKGITPRATDYSAWYLDVIERGDLVAESPVRGCKVLKPHGYAIWEHIQRILDGRFKDTGHQNAYFPLFIPQSFLSREAQHVEGFAKECAVVTHHRLRTVTRDGVLVVEPDPEAKLAEPLIVRPTSETIIWHMYKQWVDSWRDLPLLINQWANVVRWEMKTRPFLRTTEFLWQEGHTAHATSDEAATEARLMLDVYEDFARNTLALPMIKGRKSARERFAGAVETYTIESLMQNGWALQAGTSHFLGQNFAKAFDVTFQNRDGQRDFVWGTSWGVTTRLIGALVMTHGDDQGLVLPPAVAPIQVVIVPVYKDTEKATVLEAAHRLAADLKPHFRVRIDDRDHLRPGAKYFEWERKGVPLRLEVGPRDVAKGQAFAAPRVAPEGAPGGKFGLPFDRAVEIVRDTLGAQQTSLLRRADDAQRAKTFEVGSMAELEQALDARPGFYRIPWGGDDADEDRVKDLTRATLRCFPLGEPSAEGLTCPLTGKPAREWALFARAY